MKFFRVHIVVILLVLFFVIHRLTYQSAIIPKISSVLLYPVLYVHAKIVDPIAMWVTTKQDIACLQKRIEILTNTVENLQAENIRLSAVQRYEKDIAEIILFNKRFKNPGILAHVLVKKISNSEHYFLINRGENQGIKKDMFAYFKNNVIGKVAEVYPWYSKVLLITDATCKVAAVCAKTNARGIHEGQNDDRITSLTFVNHLEEIQKGDLVLSSGEGFIFPSGFSLGKITNAERGISYYDIAVEPLVDFNSLRYCSIQSKEAMS